MPLSTVLQLSPNERDAGEVLDHPQFRISLIVVGEPPDVDGVSQALGVTPTFIKGQPMGRASRIARHSMWSLKFPPFHAWSVEEAAARFIGPLRAKAAVFQRLRRGGLDVRFTVVCVLPPPEESTAHLGLSTSTIEDLAAIGASYDIDLYRFGEYQIEP
jgi:hypothetical protein